jgi:hypothetical protein
MLRVILRNVSYLGQLVAEQPQWPHNSTQQDAVRSGHTRHQACNEDAAAAAAAAAVAAVVGSLNEAARVLHTHCVRHLLTINCSHEMHSE